MNTAFRLGCVFALSLMVVACKKANSLEGTWVGGGPGSFTFTGNNFKMQGGIAEAGLCTITGTFTLEGDQLNLLPTDVSIKGKDSAQQAEIDQHIQEVKPAMLKVLTEENPIAVTWQDEDHISIKTKTYPLRYLERAEVSAPGK